MTEQRRLAAILVADVVGYSKLVGGDEAGTLAKLGDLRREIIEPAIGNYSLGHGLLDACMSEAARVLRPGGVLFIYDLTTNDQAYVIPRVGYRRRLISSPLWVY